jgi:predicted PurR-regulated permease PerM
MNAGEVREEDSPAAAVKPAGPGHRGPASRPLLWLVGLALLYTLYFARSLLMPVVVALLLALLLSPLVSIFKRFHVPRTISALILLTAIGGPVVLLGGELAEPAKKWIQLLPELSARLDEELDAFSQALQAEGGEAGEEGPADPEQESKWYDFLDFFGDKEEKAEPPPPARAQGESALSVRLMQGGLELLISVLGAAPVVIAQFTVCVILVLFLLIFGPNLYDTFIEVVPSVKDKRKATQLVGRVQRELSRYILTVSLINAALGMTTAAVLWLMGVDDALLWGAVVGLLNFAPYIGPVIGVCLLSLAGIVQYGLVPGAMLPALLYFAINMVEAQFVTPTVLGQRMQLNPLVLMVWLILWGWLWGAVGVLLAVPLLVCIKLAAEQLNVLDPWVRLIGARA